ncbi:hypothetical protein CDD82_2341 [Ophiocordyceps australis]|uniref:Cytoplasmic tRNA 2-thiolation protein 2 n=1 Tax=Ophiocordyceps australis TaxID=1399860 RepID=A0A2C5ZI86_9HYPO|nr:hypothetical protein CDD82_2341 [Ophiocordyceps australis]
MSETASASKPCKRCKAPDAPLRLRNDPTCRPCYVAFVESKAGRRLGALARDTRTSARPAPRRYLGGLSFGSSSTLMTQVLDNSARFHSSQRSSPAFEAHLVHIDTRLSRHPNQHDSPAQRLLDAYRKRFTRVSFECVHLCKALTLDTIDWSLFPSIAATGHVQNEMERLECIMDSLPSATSRADVTRLLTRHILLHMALQGSYAALILGHSTTALASMALSEVANGRGYSIPWQISDGIRIVSTSPKASDGTEATDKVANWAQIAIYYPLREVMRHEIMQYLELVPSLRELMPTDSAETSNSIVSHKDLSIEQVMQRYFDSVEGSYSGIVANVVRTAGKLDTFAHDSSLCALCGMTLDEKGDSHWAGELGHSLEPKRTPTVLCYGCKRSING